MTENPNAAAENLLTALSRSLAAIALPPSGEIIATNRTLLDAAECELAARRRIDTHQRGQYRDQP